MLAIVFTGKEVFSDSFKKIFYFALNKKEMFNNCVRNNIEYYGGCPPVRVCPSRCPIENDLKNYIVENFLEASSFKNDVEMLKNNLNTIFSTVFSREFKTLCLELNKIGFFNPETGRDPEFFLQKISEISKTMEYFFNKIQNEIYLCGKNIIEYANFLKNYKPSLENIFESKESTTTFGNFFESNGIPNPNEPSNNEGSTTILSFLKAEKDFCSCNTNEKLGYFYINICKSCVENGKCDGYSIDCETGYNLTGDESGNAICKKS